MFYLQMLVRTLHTCSVKFPDVANSIVPLVGIINHLYLTTGTNVDLKGFIFLSSVNGIPW